MVKVVVVALVTLTVVVDLLVARTLM